MKETPELKKAHSNMLPGVITADGFLGKETRTLADILIADEAAVQHLGTSHEAIARRMEELKKAGSTGLGFFEPVEPHFEVEVLGVRGGLPCPFGCAGLIPKSNTTVKNIQKTNQITYTDLSIHLIAHHGFYQGRGAHFRLDPAHLVDVLEVPLTPMDHTKIPNLPSR